MSAKQSRFPSGITAFLGQEVRIHSQLAKYSKSHAPLRMKMTPANPAVGNWRNNGQDMLNPPS
jgi:hypothetical protein